MYIGNRSNVVQLVAQLDEGGVDWREQGHSQDDAAADDLSGWDIVDGFWDMEVSPSPVYIVRPGVRPVESQKI